MNKLQGVCFLWFPLACIIIFLWSCVEISDTLHGVYFISLITGYKSKIFMRFLLLLSLQIEHLYWCFRSLWTNFWGAIGIGKNFIHMVSDTRETLIWPTCIYRLTMLLQIWRCLLLFFFPLCYSIVHDG